MLIDHNPLVQTLLGTLFTWGLTAAGAAMVIIFSGTQRKLLDSSLGFAAGVMLAASYWSLLAQKKKKKKKKKNNTKTRFERNPVTWHAMPLS
ncbi:zinc transporter ZIP11 [Diaphorina citri]|uniref:Zinc transporter ZIP11 n=1 Tax=Diaphorina citri TaxID=121845 RepID=A0A3Q0J122_DIACI|nr:zinc transporter ZIP11 [Diaphorina citri]